MEDKINLVWKSGQVFVPRFVNRQNAIPKEAAEAAARIPAAVPIQTQCRSNSGFHQKYDGETAGFFIRNVSASQSIPRPPTVRSECGFAGSSSIFSAGV